MQRVLTTGGPRAMRQLRGRAEHINALAIDRQGFTDAELAHGLNAVRVALHTHTTPFACVDEIFATVIVAAERHANMRPYEVQIMGACALVDGKVVEMRTGEGKTLTALLPAAAWALAGGAHVVTVNEYLATRDAAMASDILGPVGLSVGVIGPTRSTWADKRAAYGSDLVYATATELGFDYLRDHLIDRKGSAVQRQHNFVLIDEIDSILIDEARTPLIISSQQPMDPAPFVTADRIVTTLDPTEHLEVREETQQVWLTEQGVAFVEDQLGVALYDHDPHGWLRHINLALHAHWLQHRDHQYVVVDGKVEIVDPATGRILPDRQWGEGLHQAVEAKEGCELSPETVVSATITLQNYFRLYDHLAGMSGTVLSAADEFAGTYGLAVSAIPTHRQVIRIDHPDQVYPTATDKLGAIVDDVAECFERGQPVLVGTSSVQGSEVLSHALTDRGVTHQVLNAKQHDKEAAVLAQAGRLHAVTVATNMAGRGVDILLGGNPVVLAQGDPDRLAELSEQCTAESVIVRSLGGLCVIGTDRHDSRRIDDQLRGRAGRQGDPGESQFYLSLDDRLMQLFAPRLMQWAMRNTLEPGVALASTTVSKAIEQAQAAVEGTHASGRQTMIRYDELLASHRRLVYQQRNDILNADSLREQVRDCFVTTVTTIVDDHCDDWLGDVDTEALTAALADVVPAQLARFDPAGCDTADELVAQITGIWWGAYSGMAQAIGEPSMTSVERASMLRVFDEAWRQYLTDMDHMRAGMHLRSYAQSDPLAAWVREGTKEFNQFSVRWQAEMVRFVTHLRITRIDPPADDDNSRDDVGVVVGAKS